MEAQDYKKKRLQKLGALTPNDNEKEKEFSPKKADRSKSFEETLNQGEAVIMQRSTPHKREITPKVKVPSSIERYNRPQEDAEKVIDIDDLKKKANLMQQQFQMLMDQISKAEESSRKRQTEEFDSPQKKIRVEEHIELSSSGTSSDDDEDKDNSDEEKKEPIKATDVVQLKAINTAERRKAKKIKVARLRKKIKSWPLVDLANDTDYLRGSIEFKPEIRYTFGPIPSTDDRLKFFTVRYEKIPDPLNKGHKKLVMFKAYNGITKEYYSTLNLKTDRERMADANSSNCRNVFAREANLLFPGLPREGKDFYMKDLNVAARHDYVYGSGMHSYKPFISFHVFVQECANIKSAIYKTGARVAGLVKLDEMINEFKGLPSVNELQQDLNLQYALYAYLSQEESYYLNDKSCLGSMVNSVKEILFPPQEMEALEGGDGMVQRNGMYLYNPETMGSSEAANAIGWPWYKFGTMDYNEEIDLRRKTYEYIGEYDIYRFCVFVVLSQVYVRSTGSLRASGDAIMQAIYPAEKAITYMKKLFKWKKGKQTFTERITMFDNQTRYHVLKDDDEHSDEEEPEDSDEEEPEPKEPKAS